MSALQSVEWKRVLPGFSAVYGIGLLTLLVLPFVFSVLISGLGMDEVQAGSMVTYGLVAMCAGSLIVAPFMHKIPVRALAIVGALLALAGNFFLSSMDDVSTIVMPAFLVSGFGAGLTMAAGNAYISGAKDAVKSYNQVVFLGTILFVILLFLTPRLMQAYSHRGVFGILAGINLIMLTLLFMMKKDPANSETATVKTALSEDNKTVLFSGTSIAILALVFFYYVRDTMVWVYAERIGDVRLGLSAETIGSLFSIHGLLSLLGPVALIWMARRFNQLTLLVGGIVATGLITITVSQTQTVTIYSAMVLIWAMVHFYTHSCFMGIASRFDSKGRVAAAAGGVLMAGNAIAPLVAGYVVNAKGYPGLGVALGILVILTLIAGVLSLRGNWGDKVEA